MIVNKRKERLKFFLVDAENYSVSIIVPNYNNGRFLRKLVESVEEQTYPIKEIVIVDDCSTDNSKQVIHTLCEEYFNIIPVYLKENGGVSKARNIGFEASTGKYVSFLDADDFYCNPRKIENEINLIRSYEPENILAFSYMADCDVDERNYREDWNRYYPSGDVHLKFFFGGFFTHYQTMKRELFIEAGQYPENMRLYEDLKLLTILGKKYRFIFTGEFGPVYRHGTNGLSSNVEGVNEKVEKELLSEYYNSLSILDKIRVNLLRKMSVVRRIAIEILCISK